MSQQKLVTKGRCLLKSLLKAKKISQRELASMLNISESQVSEWSTNDTMMSLITAINVSRVLDCKVEDLYEWE